MLLCQASKRLFLGSVYSSTRNRRRVSCFPVQTKTPLKVDKGVACLMVTRHQPKLGSFEAQKSNVQHLLSKSPPCSLLLADHRQRKYWILQRFLICDPMTCSHLVSSTALRNLCTTHSDMPPLTVGMDAIVLSPAMNISNA
jgi:hypothetical protein